MITIDDIRRASDLLRGVAHRTPLLSSCTFNNETGNRVWFKAENLQRVGAFKFRGAYNKLASLTGDERRRGVLAHSSGNHAQGVALASRLFGVQATIVMPHNSVKSKVAATRDYGAAVVFCEDSTDERERVAAALIERHGYTLVHPYNDPLIIAGQGTVGLEVAEDLADLDYLFVPVGGGGLIAGCAVAVKQCCPSAKVIGVETEGANDAYQSFRQKTIVKLTKTDTIADGMRTLSVGTHTFEIIMQYVDDVITVRDADLAPMIRFFFERMKIVVEPTGAVAPAAVRRNALNVRDKKVCAVISGGNIEMGLASSLLS